VTEPAYTLPAGARVLVTGASGFTGSVLVRKLVTSGARVRAIARASSNLAPLKDLTVEWIRGEVYDPDTVRRAMTDMEYVIHVAAAYREAGIRDEVYRKVHVDSTRLLAETACKILAFRRFVHVSTVGVHGHIEHPPADETAPFRPGDIYQVTKAEAETWLHAFAREHGLAYSVIRPAAIYGPGDRRLLKVFRMANHAVFPLLGSGRCLYHLVHVEDLADSMILAAAHPAAVGEAFIAGSPEASSLEAIGRTIAGALGRPFRPIRLPAWPFFLAADVCECFCKPLGISPPLYRRRVAFFTKDRAFDTRKIRERLGFKNRYSDADGLAATTRWYRDHGWL